MKTPVLTVFGILVFLAQSPSSYATGELKRWLRLCTTPSSQTSRVEREVSPEIWQIWKKIEYVHQRQGLDESQAQLVISLLDKNRPDRELSRYTNARISGVVDKLSRRELMGFDDVPVLLEFIPELAKASSEWLERWPGTSRATIDMLKGTRDGKVSDYTGVAPGEYVTVLLGDGGIHPYRRISEVHSRHFVLSDRYDSHRESVPFSAIQEVISKTRKLKALVGHRVEIKRNDGYRTTGELTGVQNGVVHIFNEKTQSPTVEIIAQFEFSPL